MKFSLTRYVEIITFIFIALLLFLRDQNAFIHPMFWAEDGVTFFQQNIILGWHAIFTSYGGYLDLLIRVAAKMAGYFSFNWQPALYNYAALFIILFVVRRIFSGRVKLPIGIKVGFSLAMVLVPSNGETFMILTNIQFVSAILLLLLLIQAPPTKPSEYIADVSIALLVGLSGPFCILFFPLFLWQHYKERTLYSGGLLLVIIVVVSIQIYCLLHSEKLGIGSSHPGTLIDWFRDLGPRMWSIMFGNPVKIKHLIPYVLSAILFWLILPLYLFPRSRVSFFLFAAAFFIVTTSVFRTGIQIINFYHFVTGGRYDYIPAVMVAWLLLLSVWLNQSLAKRSLAGFLLFLMLYHSLTHYDHIRKNLISWSRYYAEAKTANAFFIPINPDWQIFCNNYSCDNERRI